MVSRGVDIRSIVFYKKGEEGQKYQEIGPHGSWMTPP